MNNIVFAACLNDHRQALAWSLLRDWLIARPILVHTIFRFQGA